MTSDTSTGTADKWIRYITIGSVAAVGLTAAVLSYRHQYDMAASHGESALTAKMLPISIDGLLLVGTLAVLDAIRRQGRHTGAARVAVGLGVAMTMWANIVHGLGYGREGVILSGWPPVALMASIEVLARMLRPALAESAPVRREAPLPESAPAPAPIVLPESAPGVHPVSAPESVPLTALAPAPESTNGHSTRERSRKVITADAAERRYATMLQSGSVPSIRKIRAEMRVGQQRGA